ncbi:hypothetical protein [Williamwhitmania taraxaci]|uniref:Uncharacterized protein n=1 Tax=Williamwhitmania taraxaci TaxID=1640674 RepID=A0A1G6IA88_9BACT|nr:hypothetical protein [Williamwhitmania taraxaci]SDC03437.1 hypothetical protein SAMN05216323_101524 [Williamwhitmania taraxaci]
MEAEDALVFRVDDTTTEKEEPPSSIKNVANPRLAINNGYALPLEGKLLSTERTKNQRCIGKHQRERWQKPQLNPTHRNATSRMLVKSMQPCSG